TNRPDDADPADWFAGSVDRRDTLTAKLRARNHELLAQIDAVTLVQGHAHFVGPRRVEVRAGEDRLVIEARTVVVNTGSVPRLPDIEGVDGPRVYDSTALQHVDPLPERLLIGGGGYVWLEFAG